MYTALNVTMREKQANDIYAVRVPRCPLMRAVPAFRGSCGNKNHARASSFVGAIKTLFPQDVIPGV